MSLLLILLAGCGTDQAAFNRAASIAAEASLTNRAIAAGEQKAPDIEKMPKRCYERVSSGKKEGIRLDAYALQANAALVRANDEKIACTALADKKIDIANGRAPQ